MNKFYMESLKWPWGVWKSTVCVCMVIIGFDEWRPLWWKELDHKPFDVWTIQPWSWCMQPHRRILRDFSSITILFCVFQLNFFIVDDCMKIHYNGLQYLFMWSLFMWSLSKFQQFLSQWNTISSCYTLVATGLCL